MTSRTLRTWTTSGLLVAAVAAVTAWLWPTSIDVDAVTIGRGSVTDSVTDQGVARVRKAYVIASPVAGRVERVLLEPGDRVIADRTIVARVRPASAELLDARTRAQAQSAVQAARSTLAAAVAQRDRLEAEAERTQVDGRRFADLARDGIITRQSLDKAQADADQAAHALQAADADILTKRAGVTSAEAVLGAPLAAGTSIPVTSPASGVVTRVLQQSERTVVAGTPLVEIGDTAGLEAAIEFLTQDVVSMRPGQRAEIYNWGGPAAIPAEVRRIEPQGFTKISALGVEEQRTVVVLQFTAAPASWLGLAPGYRVWGRVFVRTVPSAVVAPLGALVRDRGSWAVFRVEQGRARLRAIEVGILTDRDAEVCSGLAAGDVVVVYPSDLVRDNARVKSR